uniref:KRAB domain-containing protein n=1 Tax=Capra hircus TaxID=9925 RepID=A0A8C2RJV5_CAPHI
MVDLRKTFMLFHNVVMEFTQEERQLSSHAQRTLYRHVMLQNYSKLVLLGNSNTDKCPRERRQDIGKFNSY